MKKLALIFDMDGVIVDNHRYHLRSWLQFFEQHDIAMDEQEYKEKVNGRVMSAVLPDLFGKSMSEEEIRRLGEQKESAYREIYRGEITPTPGLEDFLKVLDRENIPRAVATSAPTANVTFTMEHTRLGQYFPTIIDDSMVSKGKPDPEVYLMSAERLSMAPEHCVVFEDAMLGIQAGKNAGMRVVGVATTHTVEELEATEADWVIQDFRELSLERLREL